MATVVKATFEPKTCSVFVNILLFLKIQFIEILERKLQ